MDLNEYILSLMNDISADADTYLRSIEESFLENVLEKLKENETIADYNIGYFKNTGRHNRRIEFDGYYHEKSDGTYNFFLVDELEEESTMLNNQRIDSLVKQIEEFIRCSIEQYYLKWEESSYGHEVASEILRLYKNRDNASIDNDIKRIRIYILTNKVLSSRFKNKPRDVIYNIPVEYSIVDATMLYEMAKSGFEKDPVNINFKDYDVNGIPILQCTSIQGQFESYLGSIPGDVLAQIYLDHGAQVLEGNVRAFLSVRGKVNKGIRKTILSEPQKFFILNNGITVTASSIKMNNSGNRDYISHIENMQIVNGGQTTASLANALLKEKADLSEVDVMIKLSVIENKEVYETMVPEISRASNSQNKVNEADFFSNHPFHVKIEELSKKIHAPAVDGNQYQTIWFYERARGQYTVEQMKLTKAQTKSFQTKHPRNQVVSKTDLAKFIMSYDGYPHETSKGAQAVMRKFSALIQGTDGQGGIWEKNSSEINGIYFQNAIAKAIMFKELEKLVSRQEWYQEIRAYRANIVTYTIAILAEVAKERKKEINLKSIWNNQTIYPELEKQFIVTSKEVYDFLTGPRETENVTEWAKREKCWKNAKSVKWTVLDEYIDSLSDYEIKKKADVDESTVDSMEFVINQESHVWLDMLQWGKEYLYLNPIEERLLILASKIKTEGKIPTDKQFKEIVRIYYSLINNGYTLKTEMV